MFFCCQLTLVPLSFLYHIFCLFICLFLTVYVHSLLVPFLSLPCSCLYQRFSFLAFSCTSLILLSVCLFINLLLFVFFLYFSPSFINLSVYQFIFLSIFSLFVPSISIPCLRFCPLSSLQLRLVPIIFLYQFVCLLIYSDVFVCIFLFCSMLCFVFVCICVLFPLIHISSCPILLSLYFFCVYSYISLYMYCRSWCNAILFPFCFRLCSQSVLFLSVNSWLRLHSLLICLLIYSYFCVCVYFLSSFCFLFLLCFRLCSRSSYFCFLPLSPCLSICLCVYSCVSLCMFLDISVHYLFHAYRVPVFVCALLPLISVSFLPFYRFAINFLSVY